MNRRRFDDISTLSASMPSAMIADIEAICTARGMGRSTWLRDVLSPIIAREKAKMANARESGGQYATEAFCVECD